MKKTNNPSCNENVRYLHKNNKINLKCYNLKSKI